MSMPWTRGLILLAAAGIAALVIACGGDDAENSVTDTPAPSTAPPAAEATVTSDCPEPTGEAPEATEKTYDPAEVQDIDDTKSYSAVIHTVRGDFTMRLRPDLAEQHVSSFVFLARDGYYDGVTFHRVIPGFVAQAGDPTGTGSGGPGYTIRQEFTKGFDFVEAVVGAARGPSDDSAGSQWFVTLADAFHLNNRYTVFAEVTQGMDVVQCLTARDSATAPPGDKIISIEIIEG